jgi:hypothetical protein
MKTRSIYAGFLVHATVAVLMDVLALDRRHGLPSLLTPESTRRLQFPNAQVVIWAAWALALVVLAAKVRRSWPELTAFFRGLRRGRAVVAAAAPPDVDQRT